MIFDFILNLIFTPFIALLNTVPPLAVTIPTVAEDWITNIVNMAGYVLPLGGMVPVALIFINIRIFKVTWALLIRIKSFIPTMGA